MSTASHPPQTALLSGRPSTRSLLRWSVPVLLLHLLVLLSLTGVLNWQLSLPQTLRTGPMQTRTIAAPAAATMASDLNPTPAARTRIALVEKPKPAPPRHVAGPKTAVPAQKPQATAAERTPPSKPNPASDRELSEPASLTTSEPMKAQDLADLNDSAQKNALETATGPQGSTALAETPVGALSGPVAATPLPTPTPAPPNVNAEASQSSPNQSAAFGDDAAKPATSAPERIASATLALPELTLASLPPSVLLSYHLSGQEKGINYQASGELRWQRNDSAYAMSLSVKAFLLGSRHWRSVGQINTTGLAPTRFSDSWRSERAAHFDRPNQRIVFSSNAPTVPLQPGAQDQVSLYVQLAAAMAQSGQRMPPGTRLQIQTATVRDALPWLLTLDKLETLQVDGQSLQVVKWVCQPRNRFDAQVEFWVSAEHNWLPARIRITQVSGSFIDLQLTGRESLTDLQPVQ